MKSKHSDFIEYIEYTAQFTYHLDDELAFVDNFIPNEQFPIIRINDTITVQKKYMNKNPQIKHCKKDYTIAIYHKSKWITLHQGKGHTIVCNEFTIPGLKFINIKYTPYLTKYSFDFKFHILLTLLHDQQGYKVKENKDPCLTEAVVYYGKLRFTILNGIIVYRGNQTVLFLEIALEIEAIYKERKKEIDFIFDLLPNPQVDTHKALAYKTWYNAKRQNQREWPLISKIKQENSLEFHGMYYYYPGKQVALAKRYDINDQLYIPRVYEHIRPIPEFSIPTPVRRKYKVMKKPKKLTDEPYIEVGFDGEEIELCQEAEVIVFQGYIIRHLKERETYNFKAQILDIDNKRIKVLNEKGEWVKDSGGRVLGIPALPYNYKQIIHDCKKLGKIEQGEIEDLTDIGIVNINTRKIRFPDIEGLYISKGLETKRLVTFKYMKNIKYEVLC